MRSFPKPTTPRNKKMLKTLRISNIVLIEDAEVAFHDGFHVLTGETGAGKSAIMGALDYIAGARADLSILRHEAESGAIEASFDIARLPKVAEMLSASGIAHDPEEDLILKREISRSGKSRAFVNNQLAQVALLKKLGEQLLEIVGQHANQRLTDLDQHREILDLFAENTPLKQQFEKRFAEENKIYRELETLRNSEAERLREQETLSMQVEEIEAAGLKENEDEELFAEYTRLSSSEEITRDAEAIYQGLNGDENPVIPVLMELRRIYEKLTDKDPALKENLDTFRSAVLELEETGHLIRNYLSKIEFNPERAEEINGRLGEINTLKRKYGPSLLEVIEYGDKAREKLNRLEGAELRIEELQKELSRIHEEGDKLAKELTASRKAAAKKLEKAMKAELQALNMPKAEFFVTLTNQKRNSRGDDCVEFYFAPNIGENRISIKECASGGELSRIMLALQALLAGKEEIPTLVFDEIDANIGGETAGVVGEKLREIGRGHQVLCITHFPQVAKCAQHHIQISKKEKAGRTISEVCSLQGKAREAELARMAGKKKSEV